MRCLAVADLHYALPQYDWLLDVAGRFDIVIIAGDHLDLTSMVDGRAQTLVVRKYIDRLRAKTRLITCSGQPRSRYPGCLRREDLEMDRRLPLSRHPGRRRIVPVRGCALHHLPVVGRSGGARADRGPDRCRCRQENRPLVLGTPCAARQFTDQLGREPLFRRRGAGRVDHRIPAGHRVFRPCPSVALRQGRILGRPDRRRPGCSIQGTSSARPRPTSS